MSGQSHQFSLYNSWENWNQNLTLSFTRNLDKEFAVPLHASIKWETHILNSVVHSKLRSDGTDIYVRGAWKKFRSQDCFEATGLRLELSRHIWTFAGLTGATDGFLRLRTDSY